MAKTGRPRTNDYIDAERFYEEICRTQSTHDISEELGKMILEMHNRILTHRNFHYYRDELKEEMRSFSLVKIIGKGIYQFDTSRKDRCFGYFSHAIFNNYLTVVMRYYRKLNEHQRYVKNCLNSLEQNSDFIRQVNRDFRQSM